MIFIVPGYGGSGPDHWQSLWERDEPALQRIHQRDWDRPVLGEWLEVAAEAIAAADGPAVLIAHSLGCLMLPHLAARADLTGKIAGAFMVAVPDPDGPAFPQDALPFGVMPKARLPFPSLIVASTNDEYGTLDHSIRRAGEWGSRLIEIGACGHINASSGLGSWPEGRRYFEAFLAGLGEVGR